MPRQAPMNDIICPADKDKDVAVARSVIWDCGTDGLLWIHPSVVINILPGYGNISTTIQNTSGEVVPITVSLDGILV